MVTRHVRLFPDYDARPPLWLDGGLFRDAPVSPSLRKRLDQWAAVSEAGCHPAIGWTDEARRHAWVAEGQALTNAASDQLAALGFTVVRDFDAEGNLHWRTRGQVAE